MSIIKMEFYRNKLISSKMLVSSLPTLSLASLYPFHLPVQDRVPEKNCCNYCKYSGSLIRIVDWMLLFNAEEDALSMMSSRPKLTSAGPSLDAGIEWLHERLLIVLFAARRMEGSIHKLLLGPEVDLLVLGGGGYFYDFSRLGLERR